VGPWRLIKDVKEFFKARFLFIVLLVIVFVIPPVLMRPVVGFPPVIRFPWVLPFRRLPELRLQ
jgi:hypothetical protein